MEKPERLVEGYVCLSGEHEGLTSVRESLLNTHGKEEEGTQWLAGVDSQQKSARLAASQPVGHSVSHSVSAGSTLRTFSSLCLFIFSPEFLNGGCLDVFCWQPTIILCL